MPKFKDNVTGKVLTFDHEPTEAELHSATGESGQPGQPPVAEPQSTLSKFITKAGLPMAGFAIGGLAGGPPGAILGAAAGKGYGDLWNQIPGRNGVPNEEPDPVGNALDMTGAAAGAAANAYGAPLLSKLPGPPSLKTIGLGTIGGGMLGSEFGHSAMGAGIGGAMGLYGALAPLARGYGRLTSFLTTPLGGGAAAEEGAAISPAAQRMIEAFKAQGIDPQSPEAQSYIARAARPGGTVRPSFAAAPQAAPPGPVVAPSAPMRVSKLTPGGTIDEASLGNLLRVQPQQDAAEAAVRSVRPDYAPGVRPNLTQTPSLSHGADVSVTGDWHSEPTSNISQQTPIPETGAGAKLPFDSMQELGERLGVWGRKPPSPYTATFDDFGPDSLGAAQRKGVEVLGAKGAKPSTPAPEVHREYPTRFKPGVTPPEKWNELGGMDADKDFPKQKPNDAMQGLIDTIRKSLNANKP